MPPAPYFTPKSAFVRPWVLGMLLLGSLVNATPLGFRGVIEPPDVGEGDDGDLFGSTVAIGGPTLAVVAPGDIDGALGERTISLFRRVDGSYLIDGKIQGGIHSWGSVAVSPDGSSVVSLLIDADNHWRVRLYRRRNDGLGWDLAQTIHSPAGFSTPTDAFGQNLAWDGNTLVVSADEYSQPLKGQGRVHVYPTDGDGTLQLRDTLLPSNPVTLGRFGFSVALLGDRIAVGAVGESTPNGPGTVYVFTRHPTLLDWSQSARITAPQSSSSLNFGEKVQLTTLPATGSLAETPTLYVSAPGFDSNAGRVFRFEPGQGGSWAWMDTFTAPTSAPRRHGALLAAHEDTLAIGSSPYLSTPNEIQVHERQSNGAFSLTHTYNQSAFPQPVPATSLGLSRERNATRLIVGFPNADIGSRIDQGSVVVATRGSTAWPTPLSEQIDTGPSAADSNFGNSVAVSGDDAAIGAEFHHVGFNAQQGAVYLFHKSATGEWSADTRIVAPDGSAGDYFGSRVALQGDTLAVSAPGDDFGSTSNLGAVYVFQRKGASWTLQGKLQTCFGIGSDAMVGYMGLSLGGDRLVFSSPPPQGACVYRRENGVWSLEQSFGGNDYSALALLSADGQRLLLGQSASYALRVFRHDGNTWTTEAEIPMDGPATICCNQIAFDGQRMAVNATQTQPSLSPSVRTFYRHGGLWLPEATLTPSMPESSFGAAVAMHQDTITVSAPGLAPAGGFYRFLREGSQWVEEGRYLLPEPVAYNGFGYALASDAGSVLIGAYVRDGSSLFSNPREGGVYVYDVPGPQIFADGFED
ncbi:MAG: hypothetical protein R3F04_16075 [Lysobacteraceae bacterium]